MSCYLIPDVLDCAVAIQSGGKCTLSFSEAALIVLASPGIDEDLIASFQCMEQSGRHPLTPCSVGYPTERGASQAARGIEGRAKGTVSLSPTGDKGGVGDTLGGGPSH